MMDKRKLGLTVVQTTDLEKLLSVVYQQKIELPLSIHGLACAGLQHCATELLAHLRGLDERGVRAVLVAVLAERAAQAD